MSFLFYNFIKNTATLNVNITKYKLETTAKSKTKQNVQCQK